jgi:hypothetical protein
MSLSYPHSGCDGTYRSNLRHIRTQSSSLLIPVETVKRGETGQRHVQSQQDPERREDSVFSCRRLGVK